MVKSYKKYQKLYQKLVTDVKFSKNVMIKMAFHTFKMFEYNVIKIQLYP